MIRYPQDDAIDESTSSGTNGLTQRPGRYGAAFFGLAAVLIAAYALADGALASLLFIVITGAAFLAVVTIRGRNPQLPGAWFAIAVSLGALTVADIVAAVAIDGSLAPLRDVADILFMGAYLPLFLGALRFGQGARRADGATLLDTAIITLAAIPIVWQVVVAPNVGGVVGPVGIAAAALPVVDIVLIGLAAPLILARRARSLSGFLVVGAFVALAVGDSGYAAAALAGAGQIDRGVNLAWLLSYALLGGAALVPSAQYLGGLRRDTLDVNDSARLVVVAAAVLAPAALTLFSASEHAKPALLFLGAVCFIVAGLVAVRLVHTVGQVATTERRFRRFMSQDGIVAAIRDAAGHDVYMNASAAEIFKENAAAWDATAAEGTAMLRHAGRSWHTQQFAVPGSHGMMGLLGFDVTDRLAAAEAIRFQARLLASVQDAVVVIDPELRIQHWNQGAEAMFGYMADEIIGQPAATVVAVGASGDVAAIWRSLISGERDTADVQIVRRDGTPIWVSVRMSEIHDDDGRTSGYLAVANDITERKRAELEAAQLATAIANTTEAVLITDVEGRVTYLNPGFERMTGFVAATYLGQAVPHIGQSRSFGRALRQARESGSAWRGDVSGRRRDGSDLVAALTISPISTTDGSAAGFVSIARDVTQERGAERVEERRLRERALVKELLGALQTSDGLEVTTAAICQNLTKLPEIAMASVVLFGHDHLATVVGQVTRDGAGTPGRTVPATRSAYLRNRANAGPWVARWEYDGEHPYADLLESIGTIAHAYAPIAVDGAVIGLLIASSDAIDAVDSLTERLPALMDFAAISGTLLGSSMAARVATAERRAALRSIINRGSFWPVFQPIVDLRTGATRGFEALTRFADGTAPDVRFEEAHAVGLGLELEAACLRVAFEHARRLPADTWLNVNVSPQAVLGGVLEAALPPDLRDVVIEITEQQAITDYAIFRAAIEPMRDRVRVAIDDA
ncbi:MAG: PAS domain S-box protein, partial [Chloroflexota bacterium]